MRKQFNPMMEIQGVGPQDLTDAILQARQPLVLRKLLPEPCDTSLLRFGERIARPSIRIGKASRVAAYHNLPDSLGCVTAGHHRFTVFPPGGPDFTPALQGAQIAELAAGDAVFIPARWWHHIEALAPFNILVNYSWRRNERYHLPLPLSRRRCVA